MPARRSDENPAARSAEFKSTTSLPLVRPGLSSLPPLRGGGGDEGDVGSGGRDEVEKWSLELLEVHLL